VIVNVSEKMPNFNGENCMSQLTRIAKVLRRNNTGTGITPRHVAKLANVPVENVYKRVSDLRILEGRQIYSNYRTVNGKRKMFYRFAGNSAAA
jgi:predicted transcriptional regulator